MGSDQNAVGWHHAHLSRSPFTDDAVRLETSKDLVDVEKQDAGMFSRRNLKFIPKWYYQ